MTALERSCRRICLRAFARLRNGRIDLIEPDGRRLRFGEDAAALAATVRIHSPRFYRAVLGGSIGLGETYRDGLWDCPDLVPLIRIAIRNMRAIWLDEIGAHYARTLALWRERFAANSDLAGELGYDERCRRLWTLWLSMSEAGFRERRLRDVQILFAKPERSNRLTGEWQREPARAS